VYPPYGITCTSPGGDPVAVDPGEEPGGGGGVPGSDVDGEGVTAADGGV